MKPGAIAIDLGAGKGEFAECLTGIIEGSYYGVEANPKLCSQIKEAQGIKKFNCAITGLDGETKFYITNDSASSSIYPGIGFGQEVKNIITVPSFTLESLLSQNGIKRIDLLKMDIEGAELDVFNLAKDSTLINVEQITVEFHDFLNKDFSPGVNKIIRRLRNLGFFCIRHKSNTYFNISVLFINKRILNKPDMRYFLALDFLSRKYIFMARKLFAKVARKPKV